MPAPASAEGQEPRRSADDMARLRRLGLLVREILSQHGYYQTEYSMRAAAHGEASALTPNSRTPPEPVNS